MHGEYVPGSRYLPAIIRRAVLRYLDATERSTILVAVVVGEQEGRNVGLVAHHIPT